MFNDDSISNECSRSGLMQFSTLAAFLELQIEPVALSIPLECSSPFNCRMSPMLMVIEVIAGYFFSIGSFVLPVPWCRQFPANGALFRLNDRLFRSRHFRESSSSRMGGSPPADAHRGHH